MRDAISAGNNTGEDFVLTFSANLAGQAITLKQGELPTGSNRSDIGALNLTIQGITGNSGVTLTRTGTAARLIDSAGTLPGSLTINDLTLIGGNPAVDGDGGAIRSLGSSLTLNRCTLANNFGRDGGAIYSTNSITKLTNCTVANNQASDAGGGIGGGPLTLINTTITNNYARYTGGGIFSSSALLINTIVANDSTQLRNSEIDGTISTSSYNNFTTASGGTNDPAGGLVNGINGNIVGQG